MKGRYFSFLYVLNIAMQALFTLLFDAALFFGVGYLLTTYVGAPSWIYIPLILVGLAVGVISMVRFILSAMAGLERLDRSKKDDK